MKWMECSFEALAFKLYYRKINTPKVEHLNLNILTRTLKKTSPLNSVASLDVIFWLQQYKFFFNNLISCRWSTAQSPSQWVKMGNLVKSITLGSKQSLNPSQIEQSLCLFWLVGYICFKTAQLNSTVFAADI